ncbi:MAG: phosphatidylglycerophosphatase A [candidate division WOR-3 bacterium]|nr:MAG: phosphatidylglycerophosphatase A [candidate division WOR-3 bacterium]
MGREVSQEEEITKYLKTLFATGFLLGYSPVAPGTFSCFIGILIWYLLHNSNIIYIGVASALFIIGVIVAGDFENRWGKDPRRVVIDEYACILLPLYFTPLRVAPLAITFFLFRIIDIAKPPPLKAVEKIQGGWGIMLDDLLAAVYTTMIIIILKFAGIFY